MPTFKYRFKVLKGTNHQHGKNRHGQPVNYGVGDVIETDTELDRKHNHKGNVIFERIGGKTLRVDPPPVHNKTKPVKIQPLGF